MKYRTLLIGGCGFIGIHMTKKLISSGRNVTVLDRKILPDKDRQESVDYISGDFFDTGLLGQLISIHDEVIHLAYATQPKTSFENPIADLEQNLLPTIHLFDIAARNGVKLLFVSSGGTVYGEAISTPICEDHLTMPISPYGVTKLTLEKYAYLYSATKNLQVIIVRPGNPYGEGQVPFAGQGFIPTAIATAIKGEAVTVYGDKGTIRDYIYVGDLVDGIVTALDKGEISKSYNIGSGIGRTNLQIIDELRPFLDYAGFNIRVKHIAERPFDVKVNILDSGKLQSLGWLPTTSIKNGLERTFDWLYAYSEGRI